MDRVAWLANLCLLSTPAVSGVYAFHSGRAPGGGQEAGRLPRDRQLESFLCLWAQGPCQPGLASHSPQGLHPKRCLALLPASAHVLPPSSSTKPACLPRGLSAPGSLLKSVEPLEGAQEQAPLSPTLLHSQAGRTDAWLPKERAEGSW